MSLLLLRRVDAREKRQLRVRGAVINSGIVFCFLAEQGSAIAVVERLSHIDILGPATRFALIKKHTVCYAQCLNARVPLIGLVLRVVPRDRSNCLVRFTCESASGAA